MNELLHVLGDEAGSGFINSPSLIHANAVQNAKEFGVATFVPALLPHFFLCPSLHLFLL